MDANITMRRHTSLIEQGWEMQCHGAIEMHYTHISASSKADTCIKYQIGSI
jgi:hypothetical protein